MCPTADIAAYVDGALPPDRVAAVEHHIDTCSSCMELLTAYARAFCSGDDKPVDPYDSTLGAEPVDASGEVPTRGRIDRYEVVDRLGRGGMGVVYLARDVDMGRELAIKVVHTRGDRGEAEERLRTEARALARLNHRNVVTVYDVGHTGEHLYVAMEYVRGKNLTEWLAKPRALHDKLAMFLQAARGLGAAHAAGVVHRDFKPSNVMVGDDGRVRVVDFGLARMDRHDPDAAPPTRSGIVLGTPRYMAPEQSAGEAVDARTDQFAFGLSLFEALYDRPPFAGETMRERLHAMRATDVVLPSSPRLPGGLRRALLQALAIDPEKRHADMRALEQALAGASRPVRRWWLYGTALLAASSALFALAAHRRASFEECARDAGAFDGIWDDSIRERVGTAFARTKLPYATDIFERVAVKLDRQRDLWQNERQAACLEGDSHAEEKSARMACLDVARENMRSLVTLLSSADAAAVRGAVRAVGEMPSPAVCATQHPDAAPSEAQRDLDRDLLEVRSLALLGKIADAGELAPQLVERARSLGGGSRLAHALDDLGFARALGDDLDGAESAWDECARVADAAGDDTSRVKAYAGLATIASHRDDPKSGLRWLEHADGALERLGPDPELELKVVSVRADLLGEVGRFEDSLRAHERAVALATAVHGPDAFETAVEVADYGVALDDRGRQGEALQNLRRATEALEKAVGPRHPVYAHMLLALALTDPRLLDPKAPEVLVDEARRACAIYRDVYPPDHGDRIWATTMLAHVLAHAGHADEARPIADEALEQARSAFGPDHSTTHLALVVAGQVRAAQGQLEEGRALLADGIAHLRLAGAGMSNPALGAALLELGALELAAHHAEQAEAAFSEAELIYAALSPSHVRARHAHELAQQAHAAR